MGMSDCENCWETPCSCGWGYRIGAIEWLVSLSKMIIKVMTFRIANPNARFSRFGEDKTPDDKKFTEYMRKE